VVFDLDPGPGAGLTECVEVAFAVRRRLGWLGERITAVTSGYLGVVGFCREFPQVVRCAACRKRQIIRRSCQPHPTTPETLCGRESKLTPMGSSDAATFWDQHGRSIVGNDACGAVTRSGCAVVPFDVPQRDLSPDGCCGTPGLSYPGCSRPCRSGFRVRNGGTRSRSMARSMSHGCARRAWSGGPSSRAAETATSPSGRSRPATRPTLRKPPEAYCPTSVS